MAGLSLERGALATSNDICGTGRALWSLATSDVEGRTRCLDPLPLPGVRGESLEDLRVQVERYPQEAPESAGGPHWILCPIPPTFLAWCWGALLFQVLLGHR